MKKILKNWEALFFDAILLEDENAIREILTYDVDINKRIGSEQVTFLMLAAGHESKGIAELLAMDKDANEEEIRKKEEEAEDRCLRIVDLILNAGADPSLVDIDGKDALNYARIAGREIKVGELINTQEQRANAMVSKYYIIGKRPVKVMATLRGGINILALDWETGEFIRAIEYLTIIVTPEYTDYLNDLEEVSEEEFERAVEKLRKELKST